MLKTKATHTHTKRAAKTQTYNDIKEAKRLRAERE